MFFRTFVAHRFLRFQRTSRSQQFISFITGIAVVGVMLGVASLIIALTILGGFEKELHQKVVGFTTHIQVTTFTGQPVRYYDRVREKMLSDVPNIRSVSPYIAKEGMVSNGDRTEGIILKGIESGGEPSAIAPFMISGTIDLQKIDDGLYGCVIGKKLLRTLDAELYDTLLVFGLQGHLETTLAPSVLAFVVHGVYESGMSEYDDVYFFASIPAVQQLINYEEAITGFEVMLHDIAGADAAARDIMESLGYPFHARTMFQLYRNLFTWIELQKEPIPIILGLIIAVAAVNIIGTLLMLVLEKRRQIGVLRSFGASRQDIRMIFLMKGTIIAMIGTLLGNLLAYTVCRLQEAYQFISLPSTIYFMKTVPIDLQWQNFLLVSSVGMGLCLIAAYIPARLAARLDPITAIKMS